MKQGNLKIFFGYCAGVGKTYAMLEAAHERRREGMDVVIGYIEKHDRLDTIALMQGLECIALKAIMYHGITLEEFDLDQALQRHPQLILAALRLLRATNGPGPASWALQRYTGAAACRN